MKVTSVEIFDIHFDRRIPLSWHPVLVRVHTDEGISGVGEVGLAYGIGHAAGVQVARELAETYFLGADPFARELLWEKVYRESFWAQGGGNLVSAGLSGLDTALWDIQGKALGVPCYQLLGGKTNPRLRAYASQIQSDWGPEYIRLGKTADYVAAAERAVAEGFDCIKVDPIYFDINGTARDQHTTYFLKDQIRLFRERMRAIRAAIGPDVDLILEVHGLTNGPTAIQLANALEEYDILLFEEPVSYTNTAMHRYVRERTRIPLAAGERIYSRWAMRPYLEDQSFEIFQPDLGLVGGLTEGKKMCDYAHVYDVNVQVHVCGSPVATAAALHLETAIPNFFIHEHHTHATKAYNVELCTEDLQPKNGYFEVSSSPGLGIELNDAVVKRSPHLTVKA